MPSTFTGDFTISQGDGYEIWTITDDARIDISDLNYRLSNVLIRPNGNQFQLLLNRGPDFEVRNIGIDGVYPNYTNEGGEFGTPFPVSTRGQGLIENVYMGDGGTGDWREKHSRGNESTQPTAAFAFGDHTGHITWRNILVDGWVDNGFYCYNQGASGTHRWENVYVANTPVSAFRIGGGDGALINCHCENQPHGGAAVSGGSNATWVIRDSHLEASVALRNMGGSNGLFRLRNTQYSSTNASRIDADSASGTNPNPRIPDQAPRSAVEAARGEAGGVTPDQEDPACVRDYVE